MPPMFRRLIGALALLPLSIALPAAAAIDEDDLLPVDQAYVLSAEADGADAVAVRWKIAEGYYLYRHRISLEATGPAGVRSGAMQLPKGKPHEDEFFGKTEIYRGQLVATLPRIVGSGGQVTLKIKYQGCADAGLCYPPQTRTLTVSLPGGSASKAASPQPAATAPAASDADDFNPLARNGGGGLAGGLRGALGGGGDAVRTALPEDRAFGFEAIVGDGNTLLLRFTPANGYYLYRDRTEVSLDADGITPGAPKWPPGTSHHDEHFGAVIVYFRQIDVPLPLYRSKPDAQTVTLRVTFQGCETDGICYPPMTRRVKLALPRGEVRAAPAASPVAAKATTPASTTGSAATPAAIPENATAAAPIARDAGTASPAADMTAETGADTRGNAPSAAPPSDDAPAGLLAAMLLALLGGLILNLMPCVLPVLSIKLLGLVESNDGAARAKAHALWYAAGVLVSFVALGAAVLALRHAGEALGWGFQLQKPGVVAALGLVMFAFGLSLSGVWHIGGRWVGAGQGLASRSGAAGDFFTGVLAVVVAAPCTAPFMAPALGWAFTAPTASALLVFACLGLGLALPFLLVGFVPALARLLPRPGAWMDTLKKLLAFPLYATAIWLLWVLAKQRGADAVGLWAVAALAVAFAAWAWTHARMHAARWGFVAALLALLALPWALSRIAALPAHEAARVKQPAESVTVPYSAQRLADLRAANRVVLVNMTADWCVTCKANEKTVFAREGFRDALDKHDAVYMVGDWTDVDPEITAYLQRYKAYGVPLYVVYPRGGGEGSKLPTVLTPALVEDALAKAAQ
ncbi:protein-disulfide reductase DsbD family protein [Lysobacter brunescens]|uniref:Protein-disulfide reductase DsbD family protein n=1 Tax=Lysobacter brunescens TaxID=262323 RepID=A0ABW2Y9H2_9GAMM